jgi:hypothetical protein
MSVETTVRYPRRQSRAITGGLAWALAFPIVFVAIGKFVGTYLLHIQKGGPPSWLGWALLGGIGAGFAVAGALHRRGAARRGSIRREGDRILVERAGVTREIPVSSVDSGWISKESTKGDRLGLSLSGGESIVVDLPSGEGHAKLEELGLDASKKRLKLSLWSAFESALMTFSGATLGLLAWLPLAGIGATILKALHAGSTIDTIVALATVLPMMIAGAIAIRRIRQEVSIGSDGVLLTGGSLRAKPRFYSFDRVVDVHTSPIKPARGTPELGIQMELRGAQPGAKNETVTLARFLPVKGASPPLANVIEERIREAMAARDAALPAETSALLDVGGERVADWLASLKKLAARRDGYRAAALTHERLLELVEDARAKVAHRIGAAVVLAEQGDTEGLARVRVAADASASPRVRIALDAVAKQAIDEQAIAEAIADEETESPVELAAR